MRKMYSKKQIEGMAKEALNTFFKNMGYDGGLTEFALDLDGVNELMNYNDAEAGQPLVADGDGGVEFGDLPSYELVADTDDNKLTLTCPAGYFPTFVKIKDSDMANSTLLFTSQHSIGSYAIQSPTSQTKDLFSIDEMTISGTTCRIVLVVDSDFDAGDMEVDGIVYGQCEGLIAEL